jgi:hypothetical protein
MGLVGSAAAPFLDDDAIVGLAWPLTKALNQLASAAGPADAAEVVAAQGREGTKALLAIIADDGDERLPVDGRCRRWSD